MNMILILLNVILITALIIILKKEEQYRYQAKIARVQKHELVNQIQAIYSMIKIGEVMEITEVEKHLRDLIFSCQNRNK